MAPTQKSDVDIDTLKKALADLTTLDAALGGGSGPYSALAGNTDIKPDIGDLIDGQGAMVSSYFTTHANIIRTQIQQTGQGVTQVIKYLKATIKAYEANEKAHTDAANNTGTGGGTASGSSRGVN